jgi:HAD superfamily hydrolase (TIGR01549 family)
MKNLKLLAIVITILTCIHPMHSTIQSNEHSVAAYLYSALGLEQESIPAAQDSDKKVIIFDLDGVLCTTNDLQAFYEIGMTTILQYMLKHGKPSTQKLFEALKDVPAVTKFDAYNDGMRMPQIMVDWQCNAQELRDIQDEMITHILSSKLEILEKNLMVNTVLMMTKPENFIATRQIIHAGVQLARILKKLGYKLYILSNWDPTSFPLFMEQFPELFIYEDANLFDGIMTSGKTGIIKPNPEIFEACLKKFNIKKSEAIFIDDTIENIKAAEMLGITSIHCQQKDISKVKKDLIKKLKI